MALDWIANTPENGGWYTADGNYDLVPDDDRDRYVMRCNTGNPADPDDGWWETVEEFVTPAEAFAYTPLRYRCDEHGQPDLITPCPRHRTHAPTRTR